MAPPTPDLLVKLPFVQRAPGTNAKRRTGWLGRLVGRRPLALQFSLPCAARDHSQQGRFHRAGSDSPGTGIAGHRPYSANTASKARIATSFLRCWSELSELFAACTSQARSPPILLAVEGPTNRFTADVRDGVMGTDCGYGISPGAMVRRTTFGDCDINGVAIDDCELLPPTGPLFTTWGNVNSGKVTGGGVTSAGDCTNGIADESTAGTELSLAGLLEAEASALAIVGVVVATTSDGVASTDEVKKRAAPRRLSGLCLRRSRTCWTR